MNQPYTPAGGPAYWAADRKRHLWKRTLFAGFLVLGILAAQVGLSALLAVPLTAAESAMNTSLTAQLVYYGLYAVMYAASLVGPAVLLGALFHLWPHAEKPKVRPALSAADALLLTVFGLGVCMLANYLVNYWLQWLSLFGIQPYQADYNNDAGLLSLGLNLLIYAVLPGIVEELVFRGWILGALRPAGEVRALWASALIFGLIHGNLTQIPFALILGLLFGYLYLCTGRLWPGMLIHALNNALSVILSWLDNPLSSAQSTAVQVAAMAALAVGGWLAARWLYRRPSATPFTRRLSNYNTDSPLSNAERARAVWLSPPLLVGFVFMGLMTLLVELVS